MFTQVLQISRRPIPRGLGVASFAVLGLAVTSAFSIAAEKEATVNQGPAKIIVDPPQPEQLAKGVVIIQYRTENLQVLPVFGPAALAVSPRIGHLHVILDDGAGRWGHTSGDPLIVAGLTPGPHKIVIEAADANHQVLAEEVVKFEVPQPSRTQPDRKAGDYHTGSKSAGQSPSAHEKHGTAVVGSAAEQPPAKIFIDPPKPGPLSRGVAFIQYKTENVQLAPVFGPAAVAISPRVGHLHVTVDDAPWHWVDASGGPVIVSGLAAGPHKIVIELAEANHQRLAEEVVEFEVP
jgi:hypothetical protein